MHRFQTICVVLLILFVGVGFGLAADSKSSNAVLVVQGKVLDSAGSPLGDATILPYLDGKLYKPAINGAHSETNLSTGRNYFMMKLRSRGKIKTKGLKVTCPAPSDVVPKTSSTMGRTSAHYQFVIDHGEDEAIAGRRFWIALIVFGQYAHRA
jgi:hypothetical protein